MKIRGCIVVSLTLLLVLSCGENPPGFTGTETGNGSSGTVAFTGGIPASGANVTLVPSSYEELEPPSGDFMIVSTTTDATGHYRFENILDGYYNVFCEKDGYKSFVDSIYIADSMTSVDTSFLKKTGSVSGYSCYSSGNIPSNTAIVVCGSRFFSRLDTKTGMFKLADLPMGTYKMKVVSLVPDYFQKEYSLHIIENKNDSIVYPYVLASKSITSLCVADDTTLWVGTANGLINISKNPWQIYGLRDGLSNSYINCIEQDSSRTVWIGTLFKLARIHDGVVRSGADLNVPSKIINIRKIYSTKEGELLFGTGDGLFSYTQGNWNLLFYSEVYPDQLTGGTTQNDLSDISVITGRDTTLLIGTLHGLFIRNRAGAWSVVKEFKNTSINAIDTIDSSSYLIGTNKGLFTFNGKEITTVEFPEHIQISKISSLFCCGTKWFTGTASGLFVYENAQWSEIAMPSQSTFVTALACGPDGIIWIGTNNGLCRLENNRIEVVQ